MLRYIHSILISIILFLEPENLAKLLNFMVALKQQMCHILLYVGKHEAYLMKTFSLQRFYMFKYINLYPS
ncbi:hypothetical protein V6Z11_A12G116400 [Gossypium hirsutum]